MSSSSAQKAAAQGSVFDHMFDHCHWDNPVFVHGMFWVVFLMITYSGTLYYKWKEAKAAEQQKAQTE